MYVSRFVLNVVDQSKRKVGSEVIAIAAKMKVMTIALDPLV